MKLDFNDPATAHEWSQFRDHGDPLNDLAGLGLQAEDRLLDLGCGDGWHAIAAAPSIYGVVGVDRSAALLHIGVMRAKLQHITNVTFIDDDLETASAKVIHGFRPTKIICWAVWRGLSDRAKVAILGGISQTSALVVIADLMLPVPGHLQDLDGFMEALSGNGGSRWAELVKASYASEDVTDADELIREFAAIGFTCVKKIPDAYGVFWQMYFQKG